MYSHLDLLPISFFVKLPQEPTMAKLIGPVVFQSIGTGLGHEQLLQDAEGMRTGIGFLVLQKINRKVKGCSGWRATSKGW
jgi:hypothetical protein